jgi:hypothetical protein
VKGPASQRRAPVVGRRPEIAPGLGRELGPVERVEAGPHRRLIGQGTETVGVGDARREGPVGVVGRHAREPFVHQRIDGDPATLGLVVQPVGQEHVARQMGLVRCVVAQHRPVRGAAEGARRGEPVEHVDEVPDVRAPGQLGETAVGDLRGVRGERAAGVRAVEGDVGEPAGEALRHPEDDAHALGHHREILAERALCPALAPQDDACVPAVTVARFRIGLAVVGDGDEQRVARLQAPGGRGEPRSQGVAPCGEDLEPRELGVFERKAGVRRPVEVRVVQNPVTGGGRFTHHGAVRGGIAAVRPGQGDAARRDSPGGQMGRQRPDVNRV